MTPCTWIRHCVNPGTQRLRPEWPSGQAHTEIVCTSHLTDAQLWGYGVEAERCDLTTNELRVVADALDVGETLHVELPLSLAEAVHHQREAP